MMKLESIARLVTGIVANRLYDFQVEGLERLPARGPFIVVANHRSYFDPFLLGYAIRPCPRFLTTVRVYRQPLTRWFAEGVNSIPARRGGADSRAVREVLRTLHSGGCVGLFPEGERTWDGAPLPLLPGAVRLLARVDAPIVPASLIGTYESWPRWAPEPRLARARLVFGEPIPRAIRDCDELERRVESGIHGPVRRGEPVVVRGYRLARGLERLLWWCPGCGRIGGLEEDSAGALRCGSCGSVYQLNRRYHLSGPEPRDGGRVTAKPIHSWIRGGPPSLPPMAPSRAEVRLLEKGEVVYLRGIGELVLGEYPRLRRIGRGEILLTDRWVHYRTPGLRRRLSLDRLSTIVIEGSEVLQVGTPQEMWRVWFRGDSVLKWQAYLGALLDARRQADGRWHAGALRATRPLT